MRYGTCGGIGSARYLSEAALEKLRSSGISEGTATAAGIYSVENAKLEVNGEFAQRPALVFPYYDKHGEPICFERDGEKHPFMRVRYLYGHHDFGCASKTMQRYAQLRGSGVHAYLPKGQNIRWNEVYAKPNIKIIITEGELKALRACADGIATIGIGGVDCFQRKVETWAN